MEALRQTNNLVQGLEPLLTVDEVAALMKKPKRYVSGLIKRRQLAGIKFGGNSWRVDPEEWRRFKTAAATAGGVDGFRHARASGGIRKGMLGFKPKNQNQNERTMKNEPQGSYPEGSE
jgi:excisionase family DNA binding protein